MSPASSALPLSDTTAKARSRHNSTNDPSIPSNISRTSSKQHLPVQQNVPVRAPPHYTVFVRLPFRRGEFEDPPPVEWDAAKDRRLWKLISGSHAGRGDLDWEGLSNDFGVDLSFLLMQAAWLSERHMERIRKQVGRISGGGESAIGSASAVGGLKMERTGSRESKAQSGSATTAATRPSPTFPGLTVDTSNTPGTSTPLVRATISRTPSSATVTQSKVTSSTSRQPQQLQRALRASSGSGRRPTPSSVANSPRDEYYEDAIEHEGASNSESEDEPPSALARSQAFRRPPVSRKAQKSKLGTLGSDGDGEDDEDDESSGDGFLPFAATTSNKTRTDPAATLRTAQTSNPAPTSAARAKPTREDSNTTASSASSASSAVPDRSDHSRPAHPLSPRHRAQLASLSPRGSEGSPSMGSSFSDLDDASVTQSALEEALMSNMRQGGGSLAYGSTMASRMNSIRDALGRRTGGGS